MVHVRVCERDRACGSARGTLKEGWVGSKLQKKLIKNGKKGKEERGDRSGRKQLWVDRGGEREGGKRGERRYERREAVFY